MDRCVQIARSLTDESVLVNFGGDLATSGDAHRYLLKDSVRYSHVLNPKTGWSVPNAPHTVSVAAPSCVEAGMMTYGDVAG